VRLAQRRERQKPPAKPKAKLTKYYSSGLSESGGRSPFSKKRPKVNWRYGWAGRAIDATVVAVVLALLFFGLILKTPPSLSVKNNLYRDKSEYQKEVNKQFDSLLNKNKLTLSEQGIAKAIAEKFPEVDKVTVALPVLGQTPKVTISVSPPAFYLTSRGRVYVVDSRGLAVARASDLSETLNLPTIEDQSGFAPSIAEQVLSAPEVSFISSLIRQCSKANVPLSSLILPARAQELDLRSSDSPYFVKFFLGGDPAVQAGQFLAARSAFARDGGQPSEYLDVRVAGKVFYR